MPALLDCVNFLTNNPSLPRITAAAQFVEAKPIMTAFFHSLDAQSSDIDNDCVLPLSRPVTQAFWLSNAQAFIS